MKKCVVSLLSVLVVSSLVGCSKSPSDKEIMSALDEGTITIEDAKEKGWIDDAWIEEHFKPIDPGKKIASIAPFKTTYIDGESVSSEIISGEMCLVFFDTSKETTMDKLKVYNELSSELKDMGISMLGIVTDKDLDGAKEKIKDMNFPIIVFNKEAERSLEMYKDIISTDAVSVFTRDGGIYSSWNGSANKEALLKYARSLADEK
ncbi:MAG: hypothetical protein ACRDA3_05770 [Peptostreptococcaceae bacterium]